MAQQNGTIQTVRTHASGIGWLLFLAWAFFTGLSGTFHINNSLLDQLLPIALMLAAVLMLVGR